MRHFADQGIAEAMSGWFYAPDGNCKWAYLDTCKSIGRYTELCYVDGVTLEAFEDFRDGKSDEFIPGARSMRHMPKQDWEGSTGRGRLRGHSVESNQL